MNSYLFHILNFPLWLFTLLPLRILYLLSDFFFILIYYVAGYRKKVVFLNLKNSFPEKSHHEIKKIAKSFYHHLCDYFIESLYIYNMSLKEINKRVVYKNPELLNGLYQQNRSAIAIMGHYGNWEWLFALPLHVNFEVYAIYSRLNNRYYDELFKRTRGKCGIKLIPMKTAYKDLISATNKKIQTLTYFLSDQRPVWSSIRYWTTFLNQETPVLLGGEAIAKKLNQPVVYAEIQKIKRGYYEVYFRLITENPKETAEFEITEAHTRILEEIIRKKPDYWLWSHKRWKFKREDIEKRQRIRDDKGSHSNIKLEREKLS
jgi:Kdo2-lipid IVA lauroyltransferase/acyltransferase